MLNRGRVMQAADESRLSQMCMRRWGPEGRVDQWQASLMGTRSADRQAAERSGGLLSPGEGK